MATIVLKAVFEASKHIFYHILGSVFEQLLEAALRKRRKKRKKAHTKDLVPAERHTIRSCSSPCALNPVVGTCIILGDPDPIGGRFVILIDDFRPQA